MLGPLIAPSILSADFAYLADEIIRVQSADWLHIDIMDNHFVPNLTLGLPVVQRIIQVCSIPVDCHLMIDDPHRWAPLYAQAGAYNVTFHAEATSDPRSVAQSIHAHGAKAGLSIKPATPIEPYLDLLDDFDTLLVMSVEPGFGGQAFIPEVLSKVRTLRKTIDRYHLSVVIQIDGGINMSTIQQAAHAGVDCFVAGSAIYGTPTPQEAIQQLRHHALNLISVSSS